MVCVIHKAFFSDKRATGDMLSLCSKLPPSAAGTRGGPARLERSHKQRRRRSYSGPRPAQGLPEEGSASKISRGCCWIQFLVRRRLKASAHSGRCPEAGYLYFLHVWSPSTQQVTSTNKVSWGCSSVAEFLPSVHKVLGIKPRTTE